MNVQTIDCCFRSFVQFDIQISHEIRNSSEPYHTRCRQIVNWIANFHTKSKWALKSSSIPIKQIEMKQTKTEDKVLWAIYQKQEGMQHTAYAVLHY